MKIVIGADHGGYVLKKKLIKFLEAQGHSVADLGAHTAEPCDYPIYAKKVAKAVARSGFDRGVLICKSGIGMSMAANKVPGARAALCRDVAAAKTSRLHNDANVLCLAAKKTPLCLAKKITAAWLKAEFEGGRHLRRVRQIEKSEE